MPFGALVTDPKPRPVTEADRVYPNTAATLLLPSIFTEQLPVPEHAPPQRTKTAPVFGLAVSATVDPGLNRDEQSAPHVIPPGVLVTTPCGLLVTVSLGTRTRVRVVPWNRSMSTRPEIPFTCPPLVYCQNVHP